MCTGNFQGMFKQLGKLDIGRRISEKTDAKDPLMKAMGYEGIYNPANEIKAKIDGTQTEVTKKALANRDRRSLAARTAESSGPGGHQLSIAAFKARTGRT